MSEEYKTLIVQGTEYKTLWTKKFENRKKWQTPNPNHIYSFIPGTIIEVCVKEGEKVEEGECLLILEAMKMQNKVVMPFDGVIEKIHLKPGDKIPKNILMIEVKPA